MNILLTSVGRRSYLVKYFKEALGENGEVHVSNSSAMTPVFMYADKSTVTPLIYEKEYISFLMDYCIKNEIVAVISLFDVDLPILAANKKAFQSIGVKVIVSDEDVISICNDKWETYKFLINNGFNAPKTYITLESVLYAIRKKEMQFPVMIKPRWGMGSIAVFEAENEDELKILYKKVVSKIKNSYLKYESCKKLEKSVLIQEKLYGQEYGLDVINNLNGEYQNTIVKKKYAMRSGETDCAETINSPILKKLGESLATKLHHIANLDVDVFFDENTPYILEMNARFGGGYPFSHVAGINLPLAIVKWLNGKEVDKLLLTEKIGVLAHKDIDMVDISKKDKVIEEHNQDIYCILRIENYEDMLEVIKNFDNIFNPSLSKRITSLEVYTKKLEENAFIFIAKELEVLGFIAFYANDTKSRIAYITLLAIQPFAQKKGIGKKLLNLCIKTSKINNMKAIKLEVHNDNINAINFYKKNGFEFYGEASQNSMYMIKNLE